ncbi:MAG: hypothetical protein Q8R25_04615 [bacterium]|nr:hypothetical protein [bacterium]
MILQSPFLLGMLAGVAISIPLGPFGFWALHVFLREGRWAAFVIALGGVLGDLLVIAIYLLGSHIASFFSLSVGNFMQSFFSHSIVHGLALFAAGFFFIKAARSEGRGQSFALGKFWSPFVGSLTIQNVLYVGVILTSLGIYAESARGVLEDVLTGIFVGGLGTWMGFVVVFSYIGFLRKHLATILLFFGRAWCIGGIGLIIWNIMRAWLF